MWLKWISKKKNELIHYGVLGMKWGKRNSKLQKAENYSNKQRIRDRKIYGKGAERRINKRMLNGESIQSARHNEVNIKRRKDKFKDIGRTTAKAGLVLGGSVAISRYLQKKGLNQFTSHQVSDEAIKIGKQIINLMF